MRCIVGLGNPGRKYARTRHNIAWLVLEEVAAELAAGRWRRQCEGRAARAGQVALLKPGTFMNDSGRAVAALLRETQAPPQDVLVIADDIYLPLGVLRTRRSGSAGGHRGLESVINWLGTDEFPRLKVGVGLCPPAFDARDFVLSPFRKEERPLLDPVVKGAAQAALCWLKEGVDAAMNRYNGPVDGQG